MKRKFTPITPLANGCCVVIVQELNEDGTTGPYLGCLLKTLETSDDDRIVLLGEAIREYKARTAIPLSATIAEC